MPAVNRRLQSLTPKGKSLCLDCPNQCFPHSGRPGTKHSRMAPAAIKNKSKKVGVFFRPKLVTTKRHDRATTHHKFTIRTPHFGHHFFANPLKKGQQKRRFRRRPPRAKKTPHPNRKTQSPNQNHLEAKAVRAASRTIPSSTSPCIAETNAASNWLGGSQTPASIIAR